MGGILKYKCTGCKKVKGEVQYGSGAFTKSEFKIFGCQHCGIIFALDITEESLICPKCKNDAEEIIIYKEIEIEDGEVDEEIVKTIICPNCKEGNIIIEDTGTIWD